MKRKVSKRKFVARRDQKPIEVESESENYEKPHNQSKKKKRLKPPKFAHKSLNHEKIQEAKIERALQVILSSTLFNGLHTMDF